MSVGRALVDCVVLSLRDGCVFYPSCKSCLSRIDVEQQDTTRCRCSRCGLGCLREEADYRYRLPLRVTRDGCIVGVTVFGTCLNQFFGIPAGGLQRLVQNSDGPVEASVRSTLLQKAVEDCFIGRRFIFGIKVTEGQCGPWLGGPAADGSSSKDTVHFIATQMILPRATGLAGCTVVSYYRALLQRAAESTDPNRTSRPPATTAPLLLVPRRSPTSSFSSGTLCSSGLLSWSLQRSQSQDCSLTPTPPWQQSLGLVTSSAEQEESCGTQDSEEENRRQTENFRTPFNAQRGRLQDHQVTEETPGLSLLLSLERSAYNCTSFAEYQHISAEEAVEKPPIVNSCFSPSPPRHNVSEVKCFSSSSLAWEDLPFSESLTEFLSEGNKDFDIVSETNQKETARSNLEIRSQDQNSSRESVSVCHSNSEVLLEISNTPDGRDEPEQVRKNSAGCANKSPDGGICSPEDETVRSLSFENEDGDTYNCSADLFSGSLTTDTNADTPSTHAETVRTIKEAHSVLSKPDRQHLRSQNVPHTTPDKQKSIKRDSLVPSGTQELDFVPPSQSTPIVPHRAVTFTSQSDRQDSCAFYRNLPESNRKRTKSSFLKSNCVDANQMCQRGRESTKENLAWSTPSPSCRHGNRFTPKRRFWKPNKHKTPLMVQRGALNTGTTGRIQHKCDSGGCEDGEAVIVPPTPAARTGQSATLRRRRTENSGRDEVNCKRTLLDQTVTSSSQRGRTQTGSCDSEATLNGSNCYLPDDENEACDWSRDLFSDSL